VVTQQERDEFDKLYPWLHDLTEERIWRIWLTYKRLHPNYDYCEEHTDGPVAYRDCAIDYMGLYFEPFQMAARSLEFYEDELARDEEFAIAAWMRKFRHELETVEEERERYKRDDELAEQLAWKRQHRRPRN
jgi:hypothetical protein